MKPVIWAALIAMAAAPALAQDTAEGALLYEAYCAACHGVEAQGDGRMAELLTIEPTNLTQLSARNGGEFPTLQVIRQIDGRDPILAHGGDMPLFGRWFEGQGPDVALATGAGQPILAPRPIADLVAFLEEIQE
ncbi:cytochrome c [Maritalea mobilis]|uniref:c-type cytochrome n=1 Tax=Maritalea mobilis TaxID=483324 RepID=UPI001C9798FA|nr:cytochrome c [Maritalea mobilis]MBY6200468.1 cytochrome c [Maritalea mobilis]